jgi:transcriptional regulator with XRE-family HTH domain
MTDETDAPERLEPHPTRITDAAEFARELTLARRQAGLTVRKVQQATGVVASTLGGWFAGRHSPNPDALEKILRACGIDDPLVVAQWHEALGRVRRVPGGASRRTRNRPTAAWKASGPRMRRGSSGASRSSGPS